MKQRKDHVQQSYPQPLFPSTGNCQQTSSGVPNQKYIPNIPSGENIVPRVDIIETEKDIIYVIEIPGAEPDKIELDIEYNQLFINSQVASVMPQGIFGYLHRESLPGNYVRVLNLPVNIDTDQVNTMFKNGILEVSFAKTNTKHSYYSSNKKTHNQ